MRAFLLSPPVFFNSVWILALGLYSIRLGTWLPDITPGLLAAMISMFAFNVVYSVPFIKRVFQGPLRIYTPTRSVLTARGIIMSCWAAVALLIIAMNLQSVADLPLLAKLQGVDVSFRLTYESAGSGMAVANVILWTLFTVSVLVTNKWLSLLLKVVPFAWFVLLLNRGMIMLSIIEYMILTYMLAQPARRTTQPVRQVLVTGGYILLALGALGWIGDTRAGFHTFAQGFGLRDLAYALPTSVVWLVVYGSFPLANLIALLNNFTDHYYGALTLSRLLPSFLFEKAVPAQWIHPYLPNQFNTVPTYLGVVFADFGWFGIILFNALIAAIGWLIFRKVFLEKRWILVPLYALSLTCIALFFFENFFIYTPTLYHLFIMYTIVKVVREDKVQPETLPSD